MTLEEILKKYESGASSTADTLAALERCAKWPLSEGQKGLWTRHKVEPDMYAYNVPVCLSCPHVDITALEAAFRHAVAQHPILTATIREDNGNPYLSHGDAESFRVEHVDISDVPRSEVLAHLKSKARRPFVLANGPLVRLSVLSRAEGEVYILLVAHYIVLDGRSTGLLLKTLLSAYQERVKGNELLVDAGPASFDEFVEWEREALRGPQAEEDREFWKRELAGVAPLPGMPTEGPLSPDAPHNGEVHSCRLSKAQVEAVKALTESNEISDEVFFLAVFKTLLYRYTGQDDIVIGMPVTGRPLERFDSIVGHFINMHPIRSRLTESDEFSRYAARLQRVVLTAASHGGYPFSKLVHDLGAYGHSAPRGAPVRVGPELSGPAIEIMPRTGPLPASFAQRRLWFVSQLAPEAPTYNEPFMVKMEGPVDAAVLEQCLTEVTRRHEAWRTVFLAVDGAPVQQILPPRPFQLPVVHLTSLPLDQRESAALRFAANDARRPFDLREGPLVRALLVRLTDTDAWLIVTAHHIVVDGVSFFNLLVPELHALYIAYSNGQPSPLPELPLQYADFAAWQRRRLTEEVLAPKLAYWRAHLAELTELRLPTDYPRPTELKGHGAHASVTLPAELVTRLREHGRRAGTTLFTTLLSAWKTLLFLYSGQGDIVVGSVASGRSRPELDRLIGYLCQNLVLRTKLDGSMTFLELLARVHEVVRAAREHQDVPFERLVAELKVERSLNKNPFYNNVFNLILPFTPLSEPPRWSVSRCDIGTAKVDLYMELCQRPSGLVGYLEYQTELFSEATIERMIGHLQTLLEAIARDPGQRLSDLPLLTAAEKEQAQVWQGPSVAPLPDSEIVSPQRARSPVFQVSYNYQSFLLPSGLSGLRESVKETLPFDLMDGLSQTDEYDLTLDVLPGDGLVFNWKYHPAAFVGATIARMSEHFVNLIDAIVASSGEETLGRLKLLGPAEHQVLVDEWNRTEVDYPEARTCVDLFAEQAASHPGRPAVTYGQVTLTYGELEERSTALADSLRRHGVGAADLVGICVDRSIDMIVGMLAIMKCGAAYVPLDPAFPSERLSYMIQDSECELILSHQGCLDKLSGLGLQGVDIYVVDQPGATGELRKAKGAPPAVVDRSTKDAVAFVIYTSGSTGRPKGVVISHRSVTNLLVDTMRRLEVGARDRVLAIAAYSFDMAATELFLPLIAGAHCCICDSSTPKDAALLAQAIARLQPTIMVATPATWSRLFRVGWQNKEGVRILAGGEALSDSLKDQMLAGGGEAWNLYGPTEATMHSTAKRLRRDESVTIGRPIANTQIYILDKHLQPVPVGVPGELCISGHGVAQGYHKRPELTAERFVRNPFRPNQLLYKTGDLARWLPNGEVKLLERIDNQVKLRGYRIDLGEVETSLNTYPGITDSVVVVVKGQDHGERLAAYFTVKVAEGDGGGIDTKQLRAHLKKTLPAYMVPSELVQVQGFPLTPTGKVDRRKLSKADKPAVITQDRPVAGSIERRLRAIFQKAIGRDDFDRDEGFFDLGGDSFAAIGIIERINQEFGCTLKVTSLFAHPSIEAMGRHLKAVLPSAPETVSGATETRSALKKVDQSPRTRTTGGDDAYLGDALAVVGMSCHFPGAKDHREFWRNLRQGKDGISFWTPDELRALGVPEDLINRPNYVPLRAVIDGKADFDPAFFSISPRDAEFMDPQGRLLLLHAWKAIEDAGHRPEDVPNTSVFMSASNNFYQALLASLVKNTMGQRIMDSAEDYVAWMFAQGGSIPTMISNKLGLKGPSIYVGTNCSSALSGLYLACQGLLSGEADQALVGAATVFSAMSLGYVYQPGLNFSSNGRCKAFDDAADGMAGGEGVGVVLLKRARDAIADGDNIYCLIRGVAVNNDGGDKAGFYAPSVQGQADVIRKVFEKTQVDPDTVCYVEAHGTGTKIGDPIEVAALTEAYRHYTTRKQFCGIGSVKSNIGHLDAAAGMAGLIKVALSLHHGEIPKTLNYERGNADIDWGNSPFFVVEHNILLDSRRAQPNRAGLSSFGIGGTNVHALLEQARRPARREAAGDGSHLVVLSAKDGERLKVLAQALVEFLPEYRRGEGDLLSLVYTLQVGRRAMAGRVAFVVEDLDALARQLAAYVGGRVPEAAFEGTIKQHGDELASLFDDADELKALKTTWLGRREWRKVGLLWVNGVDVDWRSCYGAETPRRVSLPTYPFATKPYWLAASPNDGDGLPSAADVDLAGLLGETLKADAAALLEAAAGGGGGGVEKLLARHERAIADMDAVLRKLLFAQLSAVGLFEAPERLVGLGARHAIVEGHSRWLERCVDVLTDNNYLVRDGEYLRRRDGGPAAKHAWQEWREWKSSHRDDPETSAKALLAERMIEAMPEIITGKMAATQVMFPGSSLELVEGVYKKNPTFAYFHALMGHAVQAVVEALRQRGSRPEIRILEIGAGTGSTSEHVFERLKGHEGDISEYCYTDLSKAFLIEAEKRFGERVPYLTFKTFNVEKTPGAQAIATEHYDIVIANNVLHATRDIVDTVKNAKELLSPGGVILLNEIAENDLLGHLTFGLLEGWWRYTDRRRLVGGPALSSASWSEVLREVGFHSIQFPAECASRLGLQIVVAQAARIRGDSRKRKVSAPRASGGVGARQDDGTSKRPSPAQGRPGVERASSVDQYVEKVVAESLMASLKLARDELQNDGPFADYGLDSLTGVNLVRQLNQSLAIDLETTVLFDHPTIARLTGFILEGYREQILARWKERGDGGRSGDSDSDRGGAVRQVESSRPQATAGGKSAEVTRQGMTDARGAGRGGKEPIAIIGMSGRFPRANDVDEFWRYLERGADLVTKADRWDLSSLQSRCVDGGFIEGIEEFDPLFFNISGLEALYMEPQQRLFLEETWKALEDAGYAGGIIKRQRCGVYVGCTTGDYFDLNTRADYPAQALWGNMTSLVPSRIAYYLDFHGPALAVDTACSSSLVAVYLACQGIWNREADLAIAGGVFVQCSPKGYISGSRAGMLSPSGRCRSFDNDANGFVPAEGVGVLILKRLSEAEADGDNIYGVIRGIGINQDGTTNGITAPSALAQEQLIRQIYEEFEIDCEGIQMIEAHGTGTKLGDPVEFQALSRAFRHYTNKRQFCSLGSSKANLGHAQTAAGVIGIIKVLLAMKHKKMPPLLHHQTTNVNISLDTSPFFVHSDLRDWAVEDGGKRRAAITSLGASGTNAHVVIEEAPAVPRQTRPRKPRLIAVSARTSEALRQQVTRLAQYCQRNQHADVADVSYTLLLGRKHFELRLACVVEDMDELGRRLTEWLTSGPEAGNGVLTSSPGSSSTGSPTAGEEAGASVLRLHQVFAARYVAGEVPNFEELFGGERHRRVSLPSYPFERTPYWLPSSSAPPIDDRSERAAQRTSARTSNANGLTTTLTGDEFFLRDHRVQGSPMLPGAMFLELACAALARSGAGTSPKGAAVCLENVVFLRPLRVLDNPVEVHTELRVVDGVTRFEVRSGGTKVNDEALSHCQGDISFNERPDARRLDVPAMLTGLQRVATSADRFYEDYRELGIEYGPAFRGCAAMYTAAGVVMAELRLPDVVAGTLRSFAVHPVIVDSAMQCARLLTAGGEDASEGRLVFAFKKVEIIEPCSSTMWAWVRYADNARGAEKIDIDLADERGRVCVTIRGIVARRVVVETKPKGPPAVALLPVWEVARDASAESWPEVSRSVAIIGGTREARDVLSRRYPAAHVIAIRENDSVDDIERAIRSARAFEHLFWLSPEAAPVALTVDGIIQGQSVGTLEVFRILKALLAAGYGKRSLGWTLLTHRAQAVHEAERIDPTHAGIAGMAGSLAKEYPNWQLRVADVAEYDRSSLEAVLGLQSDPNGNIRLYRSKQWFSQRLMAVKSPNQESRRFRRGGIYVIAGGAGGLGTAISEYLMRQYDAQVVWLGRRAKDARIGEAIAALSAFGVAPHYIQADAAVAESLRRAHDEIKRRFGHVSGLIHSALVFSSASLAKMTEAQFHEALSGKVDVSVRLMEEFQGESLDLALFLSSINSYLKAMAQSSYAAACTFMDAFALEAGRKYRCTAKVINLGYCFNNAVDRSDRGAALSKDIEFIEREELMAGIEMLLAGEMNQMTFMKFSPALNTRGISLGDDGVVLCRDGTSSSSEAVDTDNSEIQSALDQLPRIRERMKEIAALAI